MDRKMDQKMDQPQHKKSDTEETTVMNNELYFKLNEPVTTVLSTSSMVMTNNSVDEDSLSFVVLGKDSMETVQASLLASFVDIQQKSMSIDYQTMISSLSIDEMQHRLTELLQENVKLKETLKQNNVSMKQQFNMLVKWQEEVMKVHQNHKQKFAETREFISHLKQENADLKTKLLHWQHNENMGFEAISANPESCKTDTTSVSTDQEELQNIFKFANIVSKMDVEEHKQHITFTPEKFVKNELHNQLKQLKVEKELESAMKSLNCFGDQTSEKTIENKKCLECVAKHQEITRLKGSIALLEQKLQCALTPVESYDLSKLSSNSNREKFVESMKQYNSILQELTACFLAQIERFATIEKNLKETTDILMLLDDDSSKMQFYEYKEKLCYCCKQLSDEQVKIITDRQTLIKSQNQFQKILSDYNSILYELEITIDENAKLNVLKDNTTRESLQKSEELERIKYDKQLFEEEKKMFSQEKDHLEEEKRSLESQKRSLNMERESLYDEKKLLTQEKISLNEEKMSLDQQGQLYEDCEKALHNEKKLLQVRYDQLLNEMNDLKQETTTKNTEFEKIVEQLAQNTEEINLLKSQLIVYEEDFQQEKKLKEALLEEKSKLDMELKKQVEFNKQLQKSPLKQPTVFHAASEHSNDTLNPCPKCSKRFHNLPILMEHIERCLDLQ